MGVTIENKSVHGRTIVFLTMMLIASAALNIGLIFKVRGFLGAQEAHLAQMEARRLKPGVAVPSLNLKRATDNALETIRYADADRPTVLYVMSPACGWCKRNEASVRQLIASQGGKYRFIGISLAEEGVKDYAAAHSLGIPLYTGLNDATKGAYKMGGTPQTIVVSPKGVVVANWNGAYLGKQKEAVEDFFDVRLPEIELKSPATN